MVQSSCVTKLVELWQREKLPQLSTVYSLQEKKVMNNALAGGSG